MHDQSHTYSVNGTTYIIGELATEFGVTTRAIRFYEHQGCSVRSEWDNGGSTTAVSGTRLKLILRGKRLGMALAETKELFELYELVQGEERQLERYLEILEILEEKRQMLLRQRQDLEDALAELEESKRRCRAILGQKRAAARARRAAPVDA